MTAYLRHAHLNFILQALLDILQLVFQRCKIFQLLERILNYKKHSQANVRLLALHYNRPAFLTLSYQPTMRVKAMTHDTGCALKPTNISTEDINDPTLEKYKIPNG